MMKMTYVYYSLLYIEDEEDSKTIGRHFNCKNNSIKNRAKKNSASEAESRKFAKYSELSVVHTFANETFGAWGPEAIAFVSELGRRISAGTGEPRSTLFLRQK